MADTASIYEEIIDGLNDNSRVNRVKIGEGWDADLAISIYYTDAEMGNNADLIAKYGAMDASEYAWVKQKVEAFLAENGEVSLYD